MFNNQPLAERIPHDLSYLGFIAVHIVSLITISNTPFFFFSSRRRHTRWNCDWSSDVCSSDLVERAAGRRIIGPDVRPARRALRITGALAHDRPPRRRSRPGAGAPRCGARLPPTTDRIGDGSKTGS